MNILSRSPQLRLCLLFFVSFSASCVAGGALVHHNTAELTQAHTVGIGGVSWFGPDTSRDEKQLARWRRSVGPPVARMLTTEDAGPINDLTIVSWNTAVGEAHIVDFVRTLPSGPLVVLLQEVYRSGPDVPAGLAAGFAYAGHLGGAASGPECRDIEDVASALGLNVYYVPSMRNGGPASDEDRGNAILSNLPLTDLRAMELPFERQRRVAIAANIGGRTAAGTPWQVRVVSAHLDNMGTIRRAWVGAEYGRARQARELTALLQDSQPTILAGDFNTWFGFSDRAYAETARAFPETTVLDRRATFRGLLRLDHVFFRLQPGWTAEFRRAESRFGSDHYPLVGAVHFH